VENVIDKSCIKRKIRKERESEIIIIKKEEEKVMIFK